jgi:hypothetical protein
MEITNEIKAQIEKINNIIKSYFIIDEKDKELLKEIKDFYNLLKQKVNDIHLVKYNLDLLQDEYTTREININYREKFLDNVIKSVNERETNFNSFYNKACEDIKNKRDLLNKEWLALNKERNTKQNEYINYFN